MSEDSGEDQYLDDIWDDPEIAKAEDGLGIDVLTYLTACVSTSMIAFTFVGFCTQYSRRRDSLSLAGLVGALLQLTRRAIDSLWTIELRSVEACDTHDNIGRLIEAHAILCLLLHLFLKARAVLRKIPGHNWNFLQYTTLALIFPPLIIAYFLTFTAERTFLPRQGEYVAICIIDFHDGVFIANEILFAVNNVLPCVLFFDGLMTMMTGGTVERPAFERAKAVLNIVLKGEKGLKDLPKDQTILRTSIGSLGSFSSHLSIHQPQVEKVIAMRRAFIACTLDMISILFFLPGFILKSDVVSWIYINRIGLSWLLTFLAFPLPAATSQYHEALEGTRDLINFDTMNDMNKSTPVELSNYHLASTSSPNGIVVPESSAVRQFMK